MNIFNLKNRVGWGNEIHIKTTYGDYAGSGRCLTKNHGIIQGKPSLGVLQKNVKVSGHCSAPYINDGDILIYETNDGQEVKLIFKNVEYCYAPKDMFFGELKLVTDKPSVFARIKIVLQKAFWLTSNIADGGYFKVLLPNHRTKSNSITNAQLWHVCPTIGTIL